MPSETMSLSLQIWLFGGGFVLIGGLFVFAFQLNNRLLRIETTMEILGKKAAKLLHSPDDHLGMDSLLDKYLDHNYELSWREWEQLLSVCLKTEQNAENTKSERILAATLGAICEHKLHMLPRKQRYQRKQQREEDCESGTAI